MNDGNSAEGTDPFAISAERQDPAPRLRGGFAAPLRVRLKPSRLLATAIVITHAAALVATAIGCAPLPAAIVAAGIVLSGVHHLRMALQRSHLALVGLALAVDGRCEIATRGEGWTPATLQRAVVPTAWLAAVTVRDQRGRRRALVILPDALDPAGFRRLRVCLAWGSATIVQRSADATRRR